MVIMCSVKSWPNPGAASIASRSASGTWCPERRISKSIMVCGFLLALRGRDINTSR
jgi:hypothetical protein